MVVKKLSDFTIDSILDLRKDKENTSDITEQQKYRNYRKNSFTEKFIYETEKHYAGVDIDKHFTDAHLRRYYQKELPPNNYYMETDDVFHRTNDFFNGPIYRPDKAEIRTTFQKDLEYMSMERQQYLRDEYRRYYMAPSLSTHSEINKFTSEYNPSERIGHVRFSSNQSSKLQEVFEKHSYITPTERKLLASKLNLTEKQVKTWFQNKRAKQKRHCSQKSV